MFLYVLCIPHVVSLHIATLAQSTLSVIAADDVVLFYTNHDRIGPVILGSAESAILGFTVIYQ